MQWKGHLGETPLMKWNPLTRYRLFLWLELSSMMTLSLSTSEFSKPLSPSKKELKIREIKFGIKIEFLTTKGVGHLITKK